MAWVLYLISLLPLFGYVSIKYFDSSVFSLIRTGCFCEITYGQYAFLISALLFLICIIIIIVLKHRSKSNFDINGAKIILEPQNINHELIGVLSAVVLPFLTVNFSSSNESLASIFMLIVIGLISTKSTIYYKNPVLAVLSLKIYQIEIEHKNFSGVKNINVISFYKLNVEDSLYLKEIGENVYYAKKSNNGQKWFIR